MTKNICSNYNCKHKKQVECAELHVDIDSDDCSDYYYIYLCKECLNEALEKLKK